MPMPRTLAIIPLLALLGGAPAAAAAEPETPVIDPGAARAAVADAREAAARDRHHEATADYLRALAHDATLVPEVAQELAYQKLWREDAERAVFYFRRYLARHPENPDREVRKGLALALSWSGRQREAAALYARLVDEDGGDGGARVGLGRTLIWNNRLHHGYRVLRGVETGFPADSPARREAGDFLLTVLDGYTPHLELRVDAAWDSDDLDQHRVSAHGAVTVLGNKLLQVMPSVARYAQPGRPDVTAPRLGAGLVTALAHDWGLHAYGWVDHFGSDGPLAAGGEELDWTRFGADAWLTWLPAPRWRTDLGASSQAVETYDAFAQRLHAEQASLSAEWRFARRWTAGASGSLADYSDGNRRRRGGASLKWKREGRVDVALGPVLSYMDFADPYPGGYWAPDWVRNGTLELTASTRTGRTTWRLSGGAGREREAGAASVTVGSAAIRAGWRCAAGWLLAAEAGYAKSSFASASGYSRTFANVSARALF